MNGCCEDCNFKLMYKLVQSKNHFAEFIFLVACRPWLFSVAFGATGAYVRVITTTCDPSHAVFFAVTHLCCDAAFNIFQVKYLFLKFWYLSIVRFMPGIRESQIKR